MTETFKKDPLETGGILLGHILDNGIWIVMEVLPPGWRSTFQYAYFEYDEQFVNYVAQNESKKYEQELSLLGLWHRHPGSMDTFSGTDDGTNRTFARLHPKGAISGLVNIDPRFRLTMYHCSNPLRYTKVDVEVGDDLIPEEYFNLKYYDEEKGQNPYPPEKKNFSTNTEKRYGIGSENKNITPENSNVMGKILNFLDKKQVFSLLFLVGLVISLCFSYSYHKVKNTEDVKALHKIVFSCVSPNDSIAKARKQAAASEFDTEANNLRNKLKTDSVLINDTVNRNKFVEDYCKKHSIAADSSIYTNVADSLKMVYNSVWIENQINTKKQEQIDTASSNYYTRFKEDYYKNLDLKKANFQVKIIVILLWIVTALLLLIAFAVRQRNFLCALFKKDTRFWFQKFPKLYVDEEKQIKPQFPNTKKNVENGVLSFFVETDKKIDSEPVAFQLVYSDNYPTDKEIRVYLVNPDLEDLGDINDAVVETKIDKSGEKYLKFKNETGGVGVIKKMYQLIALKSVK
jgi:hypothetical protein